MRPIKADYLSEKDVLGQEKAVAYLKDNNNEGERHRKLHSNEYVLPSIKTRYISTLLDFLLITLMSLGIAELFFLIAEIPDYIRALTFVFVVILYEPILVSIGCTLGQLIMNIRVRRVKDPERKIWFISAVLRIIIKAILGWLSFLTVAFNLNRRAIHDMVSGSIVIVPKEINSASTKL